MFKRSVWAVNPTAVTQASKTLGLKHRPTVTIRRDGPWWWGSYDVLPLHAISVNSTMPRRRVSMTIWHELAHAMQCERDFNCDGDAFLKMTSVSYEDFMDKDGNLTWNEAEEEYEDWVERYYEAIPIEREAEDIARRYAPRFSLIS